MDVWLLKLFNHWVARSPEAFYKALSLSNHPSWLLATCTIVSLWFVGKSEVGKPETDSLKLRKLTRLESRRRVVVLFIALAISFVLTRVVASIFDRPRPLVNALFEIPIDPTVWNVSRLSRTRSRFLFYLIYRRSSQAYSVFYLYYWVNLWVTSFLQA